MCKTRARHSTTDLRWLIAFLLPYGIGVTGVFITKKAAFSPSQKVLWSVVVNTAIILGVLGLMYLYKWRFTDLGVRWQGVRPGLLAAGLIIIFSVLPELYAAYPLRWQSLDKSAAYNGIKYLFVAVAEELWFRGLVYTALQRRWNHKIAIVGTSIAFGLAHLHHGIVRVFLTGINGVEDALVRARTGNIIGLMLSHCVVNFMYEFFVPYSGAPSIGQVVIRAMALLALWSLLWWAPFLSVPAGQGECLGSTGTV